MLHLLVKIAVPALLGLVLWGGIELRAVWLMVVLIIVLRLLWLVRDWTNALRSPRDIALESVSLLVVVPCALLLVLMLTTNIVAFTGVTRWPIASGLVAALALHFGPGYLKRPLLRGYYRSVIAFSLLVATAWVITHQHPYLVASGAEKRRLVAEKVWNLGHTFEAARHADKLFAYGDDLIAEGRLADAVVVYERGLSFDIYNDAARQRLADVSKELGVTPLPVRATGRSSTALWVKPEAATPIQRVPSPAPEGFNLVLVPCGSIPDKVLDRLAAEVTARIEIPVYRYHSNITLPPPDRSHGLIGHRQWHPAPLWGKFVDTSPPQNSHQYILVMAEDLFIENTNFVFGTTTGFHGIVSYARFGSPGRTPDADDLLIDRLAKQVVSTSIKGFGLASRTTDCVTSTSRNLQEFDRKAQTPAPEVHEAYRRAIRKLMESLHASR